MSEDELVKVVFETESDGDVYVETPWAKSVGPGTFELDNLPFYAYGVSLGDHFLAEPTPDDPRPHFRRVLRKSGNRTIRVILDPPADRSDASQQVLDRLVELGCGYEGANPAYVAVNIPPEVDFDVVCRFVTEAGVQWEHADPTYDELYPDG